MQSQKESRKKVQRSRAQASNQRQARHADSRLEKRQKEDRQSKKASRLQRQTEVGIEKQRKQLATSLTRKLAAYINRCDNLLLERMILNEEQAAAVTLVLFELGDLIVLANQIQSSFRFENDPVTGDQVPAIPEAYEAIEALQGILERLEPTCLAIDYRRGQLS